MTTQIPEDAKLQLLSTKFYKQMDADGFDYKRKFLTAIVTTSETLTSLCRQTPIFLEDRIYGSTGEGIYFGYSKKDFDIVRLYRTNVAVERGHDEIHNYPGNGVYVIENEQSLPGYCYLRKIKEGPLFGFPNPILPMTLEIKGAQYLSGLAINNCKQQVMSITDAPSNWLSGIQDMDGSMCSTHIGQQGPAINFDIISRIPRATDINKVDSVFVIRCPKWPSRASEWITRSRPLGWPMETLIKEIVAQGIYFAPVGCKDHPLSGIQWRYSFNEAERRLVRSFNTTQAKCYALLKRVISENVTPRFEGEDVISSYHIKTLMFWTIEETDPQLWVPVNLIQCVFLVLKRLVQCVESRNCPSYFMPDENLFLFKVKPEKKEEVHACINSIIAEGWPVLARLSNFATDHDFIRNIYQEYDSQHNSQGQTVFDHCPLNVNGLVDSCMLPYLLAHADAFKIHESDRICSTFDAVINVLIKKANDSDDTSTKECIKNIIAQVCSSYGTHCLSLSHCPTVEISKCGELKDRGARYMELSCLRKDVNCFAKHANYAYMCGNLDSTLSAAYNIIRMHFNDSVLTFSTYVPVDVQTKTLINRILQALEETSDISEMWATTDIFQFSREVIFMKNEIYAVPGNAKVEMFVIGNVPYPFNIVSGVRQCMVVDPYLYVTYLSFLTYCDKRFQDEADSTITMMEIICSSLPNSHLSSSLNLLGDCYLKRGNVDKAMETFALSMQRNRSRNAAPWHVARLVWRKLYDRWLQTSNGDD